MLFFLGGKVKIALCFYTNQIGGRILTRMIIPYGIEQLPTKTEARKRGEHDKVAAIFRDGAILNCITISFWAVRRDT